MKKTLLALLTVFGLLAAGCPQTTTVTIKFDANGGKGTMKEQVVENGQETVLSANAFTKEGYLFTSWNDKKDGSGKSYADKAKVTPVADLTLYAQWEESETLLAFPKMTVSDAYHVSEGNLVTLFFTTEEPLPEEIKLNITKEGLTDKSMIALQSIGEDQTNYGIGIGYENETDFSPLGEWRVRFEHPDYQSMTEDLVWTASAPAVPQSLTAEPGDGSVTLSWGASAEPVTELYLTITQQGGDEVPSFASTEISAETTGVTLTDLTNGASYVITAFFGKNGFYDQVNSATETVSLPKVPVKIVRGDKTFVLVKGFDFNAETAIAQEKVETVTAGTYGSSPADNLFIKNENNQVRKGSVEGDYLTFRADAGAYTAYRFHVSDSTPSQVVYAEILAKVNREDGYNASVSLSSIGSQDDCPAWSHAMLYGSGVAARGWEVGNHSYHQGITVTKDTPTLYGVYFPSSTSNNDQVSYHVGRGEAISLKHGKETDGEKNYYTNLQPESQYYWMGVANEASTPDDTTTSVDYIAFYAEETGTN